FYGWDDWHFAFPGDAYHLKLDAVPRFELTNAIERGSPLSIAKLKPTTVIAPHRTSYNQDHQITAEALHTALRPSNTQRRHHPRSEEHTSELQSRENLVCRLLPEKKHPSSSA